MTRRNSTHSHARVLARQEWAATSMLSAWILRLKDQLSSETLFLMWLQLTRFKRQSFRSRFSFSKSFLQQTCTSSRGQIWCSLFTLLSLLVQRVYQMARACLAINLVALGRHLNWSMLTVKLWLVFLKYLIPTRLEPLKPWWLWQFNRTRIPSYSWTPIIRLKSLVDL